MNTLFDMIPLVAFFAAFKLYDIYIATMVAIVLSLLHVGWLYLRSRKVPASNLIAAGAFLIFGGLSLISRDLIFLKWKPSFVNWLLALILITGNLIGEKPMLERLLGAKISQVSRTLWREIGYLWAAFFTAAGFLNLYIAFYFRTDLPASMRDEIWVNFKVFGIMALTLVFLVFQVLYMQRRMRKEQLTE